MSRTYTLLLLHVLFLLLMDLLLVVGKAKGLNSKRVLIHRLVWLGS